MAGCFQGAVEVHKGVNLPCGLQDSVVSNASISGSSLVSGTTLLADSVVLEVGLTAFARPIRCVRQTSAGCALAFPQGCAIVGCGMITCSGKTSFGNGMKVPLGLDGDGRLTPVYASISVRAVGANSAEHTPACTNACVHAHVLAPTITHTA